MAENQITPLFWQTTGMCHDITAGFSPITRPCGSRTWAAATGRLLTHPGLSPLRLTPHEPAILFESSLIQIGATQFEVSGIADFQHEALGTVGFQFQEVMADMCQLSPSLSTEKKEGYRVALQELEQHIMEAQTEQELLRVIAQDLQKLTTAYLLPDDINQTIVFDPSLSLPPAPR